MRLFEKPVPKSLKSWFVIHFLVDMIFAIPLMFKPEWVLELIGMENESILAVRLVGAALFGIGGVSLIAREKSKETYNALLTMKILWSAAAQVAITLALLEGAPNQIAWIMAVFFLFMVLWIYYKIRLY